jgi:hypothetical protein
MEQDDISVSPNTSTIGTTKPRRMGWAENVARMGEKGNACRILVGKPERKRPVGSSRRRWNDDIKMDLREIEWRGTHWIDLVQEMEPWRALVDTVINLRVP